MLLLLKEKNHVAIRQKPRKSYDALEPPLKKLWQEEMEGADAGSQASDAGSDAFSTQKQKIIPQVLETYE